MNGTCLLSAPLRIDRIGQRGAHDVGQSFEHRTPWKRLAECQPNGAHRGSRLFPSERDPGVGNPTSGQAGCGHQRDAGTCADQGENRGEARVLDGDA